jgi:hypothetical protein
LFAEIDGLRIINSNYVVFLETVKEHQKLTFSKKSQQDFGYYDEEDENDGPQESPASILLKALKYYDTGVPKAETFLK